MSHHLTYLQAVVTGLVQGVTELFPVSSLGHNVLIPALIGGSWAQDLNVSAPGSPYLSFVVGLHVATASIDDPGLAAAVAYSASRHGPRALVCYASPRADDLDG